LCLEIAAEATRNPAIAAMMATFDDAVRTSLADILSRAVEEGRIKPQLPLRDLMPAMNAIAEGMFWRRAVDPAFDAAGAGRAFVAMVSAVLRPTAAGTAQKPGDAPGSAELAEQGS
jgi:hypothetical protein